MKQEKEAIEKYRTVSQIFILQQSSILMTRSAGRKCLSCLITLLLKRGRTELNRQTRTLRTITAIMRTPDTPDMPISAMKISLFSAPVEKNTPSQLLEAFSEEFNISQRSPL